MAKNIRTSAAYTTEFHHEFRAETGRLLRKRFLWFTAVVGTIGLGLIVGGVVAVLFGGAPTSGEAVSGASRFTWQFWTLSALLAAVYAGAFAFALLRRPRDAQLLDLSLWLITIDGLLYVLMRAFGFEGALPNVGWFFIKHLIACGFLPWTAWQSLRPMAIVLGANAAAWLLLPEAYGATPEDPRGIGLSLALIVASSFLAVPGFVLCWLRHSKRTQDFKLRFMSSRYTEMRRELVDARRIHESLFPAGIEIGELRFTFEYEPMRQIGGDFLFAHRLKRGDGALDDGPLSVVLLDVTGHGIPAALTVNRLHGELERVYAENPEVGPGEVLGLLNRYVHLTLASHSIYVTALCLRVDTEASTLEFASGGHPPAFLRAVDGTVEELVSTSFVLGAAAYADYDPAPRTLRFGPGDTVLAYTDGAIEARNETGQMIRIDGLRRMIASANGIPPTKWPAAFRHEVTEFRGGPAEDDTLLFVVHRVVGGRAPKGAPETVAAGEAR